MKAAPRNLWRSALEVFTALLFLLFMFPFGMVVLNSAKTSKEIIFNAIAMPGSWNQLFVNIGLIFSNPTVHYLNAFADSVVITFFSLIVIVVFSSMAAGAGAKQNRLVRGDLHGLRGRHGHPLPGSHVSPGALDAHPWADDPF